MAYRSPSGRYQDGETLEPTSFDEFVDGLPPVATKDCGDSVLGAQAVLS